MSKEKNLSVIDLRARYSEAFDNFLKIKFVEAVTILQSLEVDYGKLLGELSESTAKLEMNMIVDNVRIILKGLEILTLESNSKNKGVKEIEKSQEKILEKINQNSDKDNDLIRGFNGIISQLIKISQLTKKDLITRDWRNVAQFAIDFNTMEKADFIPQKFINAALEKAGAKTAESPGQRSRKLMATKSAEDLGFNKNSLSQSSPSSSSQFSSQFSPTSPEEKRAISGFSPSSSASSSSSAVSSSVRSPVKVRFHYQNPISLQSQDPKFQENKKSSPFSPPTSPNKPGHITIRRKIVRDSIFPLPRAKSVSSGLGSLVIPKQNIVKELSVPSSSPLSSDTVSYSIEPVLEENLGDFSFSNLSLTSSTPSSTLNPQSSQKMDNENKEKELS